MVPGPKPLRKRNVGRILGAMAAGNFDAAVAVLNAQARLAKLCPLAAPGNPPDALLLSLCPPFTRGPLMPS